MNLNLIIFIIAIVSYTYLVNEINKNNYLIVLIYFIFLILGYNFIGLKIYLYNLIIILYNLLINCIFLEGNIGMGNPVADPDKLKIAGEEVGKKANSVAKTYQENGSPCDFKDATKESVLAMFENCPIK